MRPLAILALLGPVLLSACSQEPVAAEDGALSAQSTPTLTLDDPLRAAWMPAGAVTARGVATAVDTVSLNGTEASVAGGAWESGLSLDRGINLLSVVGTQANGDRLYASHAVIAGEFADPGRPVDRALEIRVNRSGIGELMTMAGGLFSQETLLEAAMAMNPVFSTSDWWGSGQADITALYLDAPQIEAEPTTGRLELGVTIPDVWIDLLVTGDLIVIGDASLEASIWADAATVEGSLLVGAEDGQLVVELIDPTVTLEGFGYDTSLLPDFLESLFVSTVQTQVEALLLAQVEEQVPALLDETLAGLDPSFETDLLGKQLSLAASFTDAGVDNDGLVIVLDADVHVPSEGNLSYSGYLASDGGTPAPGESADVAAAISDDLLNRLLFELWRSGLLEMEMTSEEQPLLSLMLDKLHATTGSVALRADLPPVLVERDGKLQLQAGELETVFHTPDGEFGTELTLGLTAFVEVEPVIEDGVLSLDLGETVVDISVRDSNWGVSNEAITNMVHEALPPDQVQLLLNAAVASMVEFQLPELFGMRFDSATVARDSTGSHTDVDMDVVYVGE